VIRKNAPAKSTRANFCLNTLIPVFASDSRVGRRSVRDTVMIAAKAIGT
jgi:hypothetical protein